MRLPFGGNFVPNSRKIQGFFLFVRILPPNSSKDQKKRKSLHRDLVVSSIGIWDLLEQLATCSSKRPGRFLLVGGTESSLGRRYISTGKTLNLDGGTLTLHGGRVPPTL